MRFRIHFPVLLLCALVICPFTGAKTNAELEAENKELRQRLEQVESKLDRVLNLLESKGIASDTAQPAQEKSVKPEGVPVKGKFPIDIYGHVRLDASRDDARTNAGNNAMYVKPEKDGDDDDDEINLTARHTRVGLLWDMPEYKDIDSSARVEFDFYGKGDELNNNVRFRHGYIKWVFPGEWSLLAGHTTDVPGPLVGKSLNTAVGWNAGNPGFRRPQVRLEKWFTQDEHTLRFQLAAARPYGLDSDTDGNDDGEDAGIPDIQGRVAFEFPLLGNRPTVLGLGGHWGEREVATPSDSDDDFESWSAILDLHLPLCDFAVLEGELWTGQLLDGYRSGIKQGINLTDLEEVESTGGFAQLLLSPAKGWKINLGGGVDDPDDDTLAAGMRSENVFYYINVRRNITPSTWVGLEYERFETDYEDGEQWEDNRIQSTFFFKY